MDPRDQFHLGIVTDDVDATMALLSDGLGHEWRPVVTSQVVVQPPLGERTFEMTCVYSRTEPRLELVDRVALADRMAVL